MLTREDVKELNGYDLVLDVAIAGKNRNVRFYPMNENLEGEVRQENIYLKNTPGAISRMGGVIPGQRLYIDTKHQHVKVIDRKSLPEFKAALAEAKKLAATDDMRIRHAQFNSVKPDIDIKPPKNEWPTWLYHIRVKVDAGRFRVVKGEVPSMESIRKMGVIQLFDNNGIPSKDPKRPFWELHPEAEEVGAK